MEWKLDKDRPICPQLMELIVTGIAGGEYAAGEKLLSVREVALQAGVNPNTVQKAFSEMERDGMIFSRAGSGWFVAEDTGKAVERVETLARTRTEEYVSGMRALRKGDADILRMVEEVCHE